MTEPIKTVEYEIVDRRRYEKEWDYDEILEIFTDGDGSLVNPLVRRCQHYEDLLKQTLKYLEDCQDKGPNTADGWQSEELQALIGKIEGIFK